MKHQNTAETYFHSAQHNPIHCRHLVVRGREFGSWVIADPLRTGSMGVFEMISDRIAGLQRAVFNTIGWSEVDLNGRHAVVVGGGRGIGYSLVKLLVEAGCIVHVIDVHQKSLTKIGKLTYFGRCSFNGLNFIRDVVCMNLECNITRIAELLCRNRVSVFENQICSNIYS
uniref:Uncharacterized protein n=1 Tax=Spongospora subterranea TaxID=70186 RepID=A0A0H5QSA9_9EUKA|eukprot:CRZ04456.1 hypothetical protein [Spongospora subterranea]